jgi:hypothetical protein
MARARRNPDEEILIAVDSGAVTVEGREYIVHKGITRVRAAHPLAKAMPDLFKPIDVHYDVEQATAAPGEKRG